MSYEEYFAKKTSKLKQQADDAQTSIFENCSIYITGYTQPSLQELRRLITSNGGHHVTFFSGPTCATHIVANSLTARKREQFVRLKVVKPQWVVDSVKAGRLLDWSNYRTISDETQRTFDRSAGLQYKPGPLKFQGAEGLKESGESAVDSDGPINCLDPKFIEKFYARSRLHHLSTWKAELRAKFLKGISANSLSEVRSRRNFILHIDFDSFFVSVALQKHAELVDMPVGISNGGSHADIASCNYIARAAGVSNGMWVGKAKTLCPSLVLLPYDFRDYETASTALYQVLSSMEADVLYPVSVDEALVDITKLVNSGSAFTDLDEDAEQFHADNEHDEERVVLNICESIRRRVRDASGIEASVGVGPNALAARLALRDAKPSGQSYFSPESIVDKISDLPVSQLPGVGHKIQEKLEKASVSTIEDIRDLGELQMHNLLGTKIGTKLWKYSNGLDDDWDWMVRGHSDPKTVGVDLSWGVRFKTVQEQDHFVTMLAAELLKRFRNSNCSIVSISVKVLIRDKGAPIDPPKFMGCGQCNASSKTKNISRIELLASTARLMTRQLVSASGQPVSDVRGVAVSLRLARKAKKTMSALLRKHNALHIAEEVSHQIPLNVISDWIKSSDMPSYDDVLLIDEYIMNNHWTIGYELIEWMSREAPNRSWKQLSSVFTERLNNKLSKESAFIAFDTL